MTTAVRNTTPGPPPGPPDGPTLALQARLALDESNCGTTRVPQENLGSARLSARTEVCRGVPWAKVLTNACIWIRGRLPGRRWRR
jgi:hypothetical protein